MALPLRYVEEIHARLAVRYGSKWAAMWSGLDPELVKVDWSEQLSGMSPASIRKALDSLPPDFPPTCTAFRALGAMREEAKPFEALPAPVNTAQAHEARQKLRELVARMRAS